MLRYAKRMILDVYKRQVLVGCETVEQLKENLTLEPAKSLFSSEDIEHYRRVFSVIPDSVLDPSKWHIERETAQ